MILKPEKFRETFLSNNLHKNITRKSFQIRLIDNRRKNFRLFFITLIKHLFTQNGNNKGKHKVIETKLQNKIDSFLHASSLNYITELLLEII